MGDFTGRFRLFFIISMVAISFCVQGASGQVLEKGPYMISTGVNTEMMVLWQTTSSASCSIEWGTSTSYGNSATVTRYGDDQYKYTIGNLSPGTKYQYRVSVNSSKYTGSFRAPPHAYAGSVKMLAYGDTRTQVSVHDSVSSAMLDSIAADDGFQTIALHVGDYVNSGDSEGDWMSTFFNRTSAPNAVQFQSMVPIHGCRGNHEGSGNIFAKYWPYFYIDEDGNGSRDGFYSSFNYGPVHVVIVDQFTDYSPGSRQYTWLENDLATSTARWKFIVLHQPGWTAGGHGNDYNVQSRIQPLCETYGVSIVFSGHVHYYARGTVNGVLHVTTGGAGAPLHTPSDPPPPPLEVVSKSYEFCEIDIQGGNLTLTAIDQFGTVIDVVEMESGVMDEIYVDDDAPDDPGSGDPLISDPDEDGTAEHPFDEINEALNWAGNGSTIFVQDGTYEGTSSLVDIRNKSITIKSVNGPENCSILDEVLIKGDNNQRVYMEGFTVGNSNLDRGIHVSSISAVIANCRIEDCRFYGIYAWSSELELLNCRISGNRTNGIWCTYTTATIKNCEIAFNEGDEQYGDILYFDRSYRNSIYTPRPISIQNCTIFGNAMSGTREVINVTKSPDVAIENCIIRSDGVDPINKDTDSNVTVSYCNIEGVYAGSDGNIDVSAWFVDQDARDLRLLSVSPCIDAGDPAYVMGEDDVDFAGNSRVIYGRVDMGAFEMASADFDRSGSVNMVDMGTFTSKWSDADQCSEPDWCGGADLTLDGVVNILDFEKFAAAWLDCNIVPE